MAKLFFTPDYQEERENRGDPKITSRGDEEDLAVINLSDYTLNSHEISLLKKGLSLCLPQQIDTFEIKKDLNLFSRKLLLRTLVEKSKNQDPNFTKLFKGYKAQDFRDLKDLILLMQESEEITQQDQYILETSIEGLLKNTKELARPPPYKAKSMAFPPLNMNPNIHAFFKQTCLEIEQNRGKYWPIG